MFCQNCGQKNDIYADFCASCGTKIDREDSEPQKPAKPIRRKKRSGFLRFLIIFICFLGIIGISGYFFLPGLFKPYDMGIKASQEDYEVALQKLSLIKDEAPISGKAEDYTYTYGDTKAVDIALSSEEITSFFNINRPSYYALKNVQVRINPDNTIEAAATVDTSYVFENMLEGKYSREDVQRAFPMLGLLPDKVNMYCKLSGEINSNRLNNLDIQKVSVMGIPIPESLINSYNAESFVEDTVDKYIEKISTKSNASYDLLEVSNGSIVFQGEIPSTLSRISVR